MSENVAPSLTAVILSLAETGVVALVIMFDLYSSNVFNSDFVGESVFSQMLSGTFTPSFGISSPVLNWSLAS